MFAIVTGNMIRYEINYDLEAGFMCASDKIFEFCHSVVRVVCQIWVDIKIVTDGIW